MMLTVVSLLQELPAMSNDQLKDMCSNLELEVPTPAVDSVEAFHLHPFLHLLPW